MTKEAIRAEMAGRVKNLSPVYCREADAAICRWVEQSEFYREARTVFCYVGAKWEIDTTALLRSALRDGKRLVLPLCTQPGVMEARQIGSLGDLVSGKFGILAPKLQCPLVPPEEIDLALVPCCTGNAGGQRLGYGGGYYDRFLPRTGCPALLLCRGQMVREDLPMDGHDVVMDYLVTEKGITVSR